MVDNLVIALVSVGILGALLGIVPTAILLTHTVSRRNELLAHLVHERTEWQQRLASQEGQLRARMEGEIRAAIEAEIKAKESRYRIPTIEGLTHGQTQSIIYRLRDMQLRKIPLSFRNAGEYEIGRTDYERIRSAFVAEGYWAWLEGQTPEWTEKGVKYLDWFYHKYGGHFDEVYEMAERLERAGKLE
jgi:hypothetical protein